ncbi:MAG: hypothetical protein FJW38_17125 [Acidobacteria bacterium]|nr:hypothetical protein [Acidobacteriota bacterium]
MTPIEDARNLGPKSAAVLRRAGVRTVEDLREMGWQEAWARVVEIFPNRRNTNMGYGLAGACLDVDWRKLPAEVRAEVLANRIRRY